MKILNIACSVSVASTLCLVLGTGAPVLGQAPSDNPLKLSPPRSITMVVADLDNEVNWYVDVLGFHEFGSSNATPNDPVRVRRVEIIGYQIHIVCFKGTTARVPTEPFSYGTLLGWNHISFGTPNLDEAYKWLSAHNVVVDADRDKATNAISGLKFHDPEGNEIHMSKSN
jgi:catechol 2,3-dioxygenase-like lactoylglutathione lyase family enzyme